MSPRTRYFAAGLLAVASIGGPGALTPFATSDGSGEVAAEVATTLRDGAIDESSGAVVRGGRMFTVNDSGDGPYVYEVDLGTGETTGVTTFAGEEPEDVEALAPGRGGAVWVGDIGDNRRSRGSVRLHRLVPVPGGGDVAAAAFDLVYPDRQHDAEALLVHPRTGRVLVVTKAFSGAVYAAPRRLEPGQTHELERVASVPGLVTDGTFLPSGDRVLLRTYGSAAVYTYPGFEPVVDFELPTQEQGEAVAVGGDGRVYLTSEGEGSDVLVMDLPEEPTPGPSPQVPSGQADSAADGHDGGQDGGSAEPSTRYDPEPWMGLGPAGLLLAVLGSGLVLLALLWVRASLRRSRRRP